MKTSRRSAKPHTFAPVQLAYFLARAAYDTAMEAYKAECQAKGATLSRGMSDEDVERVCEQQEDIRAAHGLDKLSTAKVEAERALIAWSIDVAIRFAPSKEAELRDLEEKAAWRPTIWDKLVDSASKLAA